VGNQYYRSAVLTAIAVALCAIAVHSWMDAPRVHAESSGSNYFVEPGINPIPTADRLGQTQGKVVINLQNGEIWGFPTSSNFLYPVDQTSQQPPLSKPVYLGKFDFSAMKR